NVTAAAAARSLGRNSICCGLVALLPLIAGPISVGYRGFVPSLGWLLMLVFCVMVLALAVHLLFDAKLHPGQQVVDGGKAGGLCLVARRKAKQQRIE
ncbi:hypothetical protein ACC734_37755, partial [Rhizobium ruizarguesonis]